MPAVIDMRDLGRVNDASFDNTAALLAGLARRDAGEPLELYFAPGDWHFSGELPVDDLTKLSIFDNVSISGQFSYQAVQHQEEGEGGSQNDRTRFMVELEEEEQIWWNHVREYRFGPLAFRDITFVLTHYGSLFAFGNPAELEPPVATLRALYFDRCYMTRKEQYGKVGQSGGQAWLLNANPPDRGEVLNKAANNFALRLHRCYDTRLDLNIRGFRYGVINIQGDRVAGSLRGYMIGKLLEEYGDPGETPPVGSHWQSIYAECSIFAGAIINSQVGQLRVEWGYPPTSTTPPTGPRHMPAEVTWEIKQEGDPPNQVRRRVTFTFPAEWGYDCTDYFEPRMPYRFTPSTPGEPYRWLYVINVEPDSLLFEDYEGKSYVKNTISGNGAGVLRPFGIGVLLDGDRASIIDPSVGCNRARSNSPTIVVRPFRRPIKIGGNADGPGPNPNNLSNLPVIIASCVGIARTLQGGVDFLGSAAVASHPLANPGGIGPAYDIHCREPIWDETTQTQLFKPGRGIDDWADVSRDLMFHWFGDPDDYIGQDETFTVSDSSPTATSFKIGTAWSQPIEDRIAGRAILFTSGLTNLVGTVVGVSDGGGGTIRLDVHGLPSAPSNGSTLRPIGPPIGCYRPSDRATYGWMLRRVREKNKETHCKIRVYLPSGSATLSVSGGSGSTNAHSLTAAGWQTIESRLSAAQMAGDSTGPYIKLVGTGDSFYVSWVLVEQNPTVYSGVYTPVVTVLANASDPLGYSSQYSRVGNVVTVSGRFSASPTTSGALTLVSLSLPINSNFTSPVNCSGTLFGTDVPGIGGVVYGSSANDNAVMQWVSPPNVVTEYAFQFTYLIK